MAADAPVRGVSPARRRFAVAGPEPSASSLSVSSRISPPSSCFSSRPASVHRSCSPSSSFRLRRAWRDSRGGAWPRDRLDSDSPDSRSCVSACATLCCLVKPVRVADLQGLRLSASSTFPRASWAASPPSSSLAARTRARPASWTEGRKLHSTSFLLALCLFSLLPQFSAVSPPRTLPASVASSRSLLLPPRSRPSPRLGGDPQPDRRHFRSPAFHAVFAPNSSFPYPRSPLPSSTSPAEQRAASPSSLPSLLASPYGGQQLLSSPRAFLSSASSRVIQKPTSSAAAFAVSSSGRVASLLTSSFLYAASPTSGSEPSETAGKLVKVTPKALARIEELKAKRRTEKKEDSMFVIRLGVRSGGCSGLSYALDVIDEASVSPTDHREDFQEAGGFAVVVDPQSLLYVIGTQLDYADDLIGGGFRVSNPNASRSCGCGMSFGVPKSFLPEGGIDSKPQSCATDRK
ncbi:HesB-like domain-containing protein [Besnoitia besnoiti]|uniref:HesB-like domain-containing protein n=1 Tax=Besnoitia besnoiti TaxID=94643 RepID=A0A2A9MAH6_BESBE|nr:HesB-like domain-containing protein [Besnoitia besnoiti]PFH35478.1 HesB-like domain-containing protein [Besnoitia besnoiti]